MAVAAENRWVPGAWHAITIAEATRYLTQLRLAEDRRRRTNPFRM